MNKPEPCLLQRQRLEHVGVRLAHGLHVRDPQVSHAARGLRRRPQQARLARACAAAYHNIILCRSRAPASHVLHNAFSCDAALPQEIPFLLHATLDGTYNMIYLPRVTLQL